MAWPRSALIYFGSTGRCNILSDNPLTRCWPRAQRIEKIGAHLLIIVSVEVFEPSMKLLLTTCVEIAISSKDWFWAIHSFTSSQGESHGALPFLQARG